MRKKLKDIIAFNFNFISLVSKRWILGLTRLIASSSFHYYSQWKYADSGSDIFMNMVIVPRNWVNINLWPLPQFLRSSKHILCMSFAQLWPLISHYFPVSIHLNITRYINHKWVFSQSKFRKMRRSFIKYTEYKK